MTLVGGGSSDNASDSLPVELQRAWLTYAAPEMVLVMAAADWEQSSTKQQWTTAFGSSLGVGADAGKQSHASGGRHALHSIGGDAWSLASLLVELMTGAPLVQVRAVKGEPVKAQRVVRITQWVAAVLCANIP